MHCTYEVAPSRVCWRGAKHAQVVKRHHGGVKSTEPERVVYRVDEGYGIARDDDDVIEIPGERRVDITVKRKE